MQEKEVGDIKTEAPLVDVSEQKQEGEQPAEPETPAAEPEKKDETPAAKSEDKVEAPAAPEKNEETPAAKETEKKESDVAPTKETPLVTVWSDLKWNKLWWQTSINQIIRCARKSICKCKIIGFYIFCCPNLLVRIINPSIYFSF